MKKVCLFIFCLTLIACGGDKDDSSISAEDYTDAQGNPLVTCGNTLDFIYEPDDAAHLDGCQVILGTVFVNPIDGYTQLSDFHLNDVVHIEGNFEIADSVALETIDGLENLESVGGYLLILYNKKLVNADGFPKLKQVGGVQVNLNDTLVDVAFPELETAGNITVSANPLLESAKFDTLKTVTGSIVVTSNPELLELSFPVVESVENVSVAVNDKLDDIGTLEGL